MKYRLTAIKRLVIQVNTENRFYKDFQKFRGDAIETQDAIINYANYSAVERCRHEGFDWEIEEMEEGE